MITAVNSVSFKNNYNSINFEGDKKRTNSKKANNMHIPMAVKAIPLATFIAMAPIDLKANHNDILELDKLNEIEYFYDYNNDGDKVVDTLHLNKNIIGKIPNSGSVVRLISNDKNARTVEKIEVDMKYTNNSVTHFDEVKKLVEIRYSNGSSDFYLYGSGSKKMQSGRVFIRKDMFKKVINEEEDFFKEFINDARNNGAISKVVLPSGAKVTHIIKDNPKYIPSDIMEILRK